MRVVGISFDHMHMGDLLRLVHDHPGAEIVGVYDQDRSKMSGAIANFAIPDAQVFTDFDGCMQATKPDLAILCSAPADHATYTERLAAYRTHVLVEKPFAASIADARRMIAVMALTGKLLAIDWPSAFAPCNVTAKRLIDEG
ncbi:MAG: Gfo/Idh/MocA family oxidoreductase, partial [Paracoccaceae bacterium]